jgi:hypothetical protein
VLVFSAWAVRYATAHEQPKSLRDPIPRLYNTLQFILNSYKFMSWVQSALQEDTLLRFHIGPKTVYLVTGPQGIRTIFGRELVYNVTNQEKMTCYALPALYRMNAAEVRRWEHDKSGVAKVPIPGTEHMPSRQRLWFKYEHIYSEYLGKPQYMKPLADMFLQSLEHTLDQYLTDSWTHVSIH